MKYVTDLVLMILVLQLQFLQFKLPSAETVLTGDVLMRTNLRAASSSTREWELTLTVEINVMC